MTREITRTHMLDCAKRELKRRQTRYPRMVAEKRLNPHVAEHETKAMVAIVGALETLVLLEEIGDEMKAEAEKHKKEVIASG